MIALLVAAFVGSSAPHDEAFRAGLDLFYDGSTHAALERLAATAAAHPDDPLGPYYRALALCWLIEQRGGDAPELEAEFGRHLDRAVGLAERRLRRDAQDLRARLGRGGAHALRSRLALFRGQRRSGARDAVKMREDLLAVHRLDPSSLEAAFGIGLYDYYADVLPRFLKIVRFFLWVPGGDRERGLARIEEVSRSRAVHRVEALAQLYEIHAYYERRPDPALAAIRELRERYPGSPLWALRLAEHLRDRMGLYAESAEVSREVLRAAEERRPNHAPVVGAMARVFLGEALLLDLRTADARSQVAPVLEGASGAPWVGPRARMVAGRSLEIEGNRAAAAVHYRAAAAGSDRATREQAAAALRSPMSDRAVTGRQRLAAMRRLTEAGRDAEAAAAARRVLEVWPECPEALVRVAEVDVAEGRLARARAVLDRLVRGERIEPPWVRPWCRLLLGQIHDLSGDRPAALHEYKEVWNDPCGRGDLRARAAAGIERPFTGRASPAASVGPR
jgi:tetratricopeptide (TPR) repeat protein